MERQDDLSVRISSELNRLLAAFIPIKVGGCRLYLQQALSWDFLAEADSVWEDFVKQNRFELPLKGQLEQTLISRHLLMEGFSKNFKRFQKQCENYQLDLYQNCDDDLQVQKLKKKLRNLEKQMNKMLMDYHQYDHFSLEGAADIERQQFIFSNTLFNKNKKRVSPNKVGGLDLITQEYYKTQPSIETIRVISRTNPWRSLWMTKKGASFKYTPLTQNQLTLSDYSRLFDNILKSMEPVPDRILGDDDMIDGWCIVQNRKDKKPEKVNKASKHSEVFHIVENSEEAKTVIDSNNAHALDIMKSRQMVIDKSKGGVQHGDMPDQKLQRVMKETNAQR